MAKIKGVESEIVKALLETHKWSYKYLAGKIGKGSGGVIGNRLSGRSMTVEALVEMVEAMGCEVVIQPKEVGGTVKDTYVVSNENRAGDGREGKYYPRRKNSEKDKKAGEE